MADRIPVFSEGTNEPRYYSQREIKERFEIKEEMLPHLKSIVRYASGMNVATFEQSDIKEK